MVIVDVVVEVLVEMLVRVDLVVMVAICVWVDVTGGAVVVMVLSVPAIVMVEFAPRAVTVWVVVVGERLLTDVSVLVDVVVLATAPPGVDRLEFIKPYPAARPMNRPTTSSTAAIGVDTACLATSANVTCVLLSIRNCRPTLAPLVEARTPHGGCGITGVIDR